MESNRRLVSIFVVLTALIQTSVQQMLTLSVKDEVKMAGGNFLVVCKLKNSTETDNVLKWYNPDDKLIETSNLATIREDVHVSKLILKNLTINDAGTYTCVTTVDGKRLEASASLKVYRKLAFTACPTLQQPIINMPAKIKCTAIGDPSPTVVWKYKSKKINTDGRYELLADGLIIDDITEADNGVYKVEAEIISKSSFVEQAIVVKVVVLPKISTPPQMSKPVEGSDFKLICEATGTPKPVYDWYKNGIKLNDDRIKIDRNIGRLDIKKVQKSDSGKYKCVASNVGGNVSAVADVTILVPPVVSVPKKVTGEENKVIVITCEGTGVPIPSLTWQRSNDAPFPIGTEKNGVKVTAKKQDGKQLLILKIMSLDNLDGDNYTCIGENEAGNDAKRTYLQVKYRPIFVDTPTTVYNWMGNKANISCTAKSFPKPTITWLLNGQNIGNSETYKMFNIEGREHMRGFLQVSVTASNEKTVFTDYRCVAQNTLGKRNTTITLKKAVVPKRPSKVEVMSRTPTTVTLVIQAPTDDGGIPVDQYHIVYEGSGDKNELDISVSEQEAKTNMKAILEGLVPDTKYHIEVSSGNRVGLSSTSVGVSTTTPPIRKPFEVFITSSEYAGSSTSYLVTWNKPNTGGAPITSYTIKYRKVQIKKDKKPWEVDHDATNGNFMTASSNDKTSVELKNLEPDTYYEIQVIAINKVGNSKPRPKIILTKQHSPDSIEDSDYPDEYVDEYDTSPPVDPPNPKTNVYKATSKELKAKTEQTTRELIRESESISSMSPDVNDVSTAAATTSTTGGVMVTLTTDTITSKTTVDVNRPKLTSTAPFTCKSHLLMAMNAALCCLLALL